MKKVSIIIPVYNVENYVAECLNSVINQMYDHSKIECIIIDDNSPDRSMDIVNEIIRQYKGDMSFITHRHEVNKGQSASRNVGVNIASGEFVYFLDSDDFMYSDTISTLLNCHNANPKIDLIIGNAYSEYDRANNYKLQRSVIINDMNMLFIGNTKTISVWNKIIKRNILIENKINFVEGIYFEDSLYNYQLFSVVNGAIIIPDVTYFYRKNPNGTMSKERSSKVNKVVNDHLVIIKICLDELCGSLYAGKSLSIHALCIALCEYIMQNKNLINDLPIINSQFLELRKRFSLIHIKNGRFFLLLLSLVLYSPFDKLIRFRLFRHNYDRMIKCFWLLDKGWTRTFSLLRSGRK